MILPIWRAILILLHIFHKNNQKKIVSEAFRAQALRIENFMNLCTDAGLWQADCLVLQHSPSHEEKKP